MFCCRRRRIDRDSSRVCFGNASEAEVVNDIDSDVASWYAAATQLAPCPICFEAPEEVFSYVEVHTHSWQNNDRCDAHGICQPCVQRYVEMKLVDEGIFNIRCPGVGCRYQLLDQDIDAALGESELKDRAKQMYTKLRNEHGSSRLQTVLASALSDPSESWLWSECQACPQCLVLVRR